jgi:hypothetical protein
MPDVFDKDMGPALVVVLFVVFAVIAWRSKDA